MNSLESLGKRLKSARKKCFPKDDMNAFALRIGISRATYQKMEKGQLSVSLKNYFMAAKILGMEDHFDHLFQLKESLFDD